MNNEKNEDTAFDILARCLKLKHLKENLYRNEAGVMFVLTKYGFYPNEVNLLYSANILYNEAIKKASKLQLKNNELQKENNLYKISSKKLMTESLETLEKLGKRQKKKIMNIILSRDFSDKEKLNKIFNMVDKLIFEDEKLKQTDAEINDDEDGEE